MEERLAREKTMRNHIANAVAGIIIFGLTAGAAVADTIVIQPEQETVIREYVKRKPIASIDLPGIELNVGAALPDTVEFHTIDAPDVKYRYVVVKDRIVLVDPDTRRIVRVMD